jgi:hypothetical protein
VGVRDSSRRAAARADDLLSITRMQRSLEYALGMPSSRASIDAFSQNPPDTIFVEIKFPLHEMETALNVMRMSAVETFQSNVNRCDAF